VVDGGAGVNTVDYSAYSTGVDVNLLLGAATGTGGIANIQNANGSAAADILVGDANANVFKGNGGNDLIIGGAGADTITGGSGDDIVIGGTTSYDTNDAALRALSAVWASADTFANRVAALSSGVSYTDGSGTHIAMLNASTVFDDGASDTLTGGSGTNWFFARLVGATADVITDRKAKDLVTLI
jgi:Ca2+-binding RTX toxin-like protein